MPYEEYQEYKEGKYTVRVSNEGTKKWYINGKLHRENGPAVENFNGTKHWYINGKRHREDGPAIEYSNGAKRWYLKGKYYSKEVYYSMMWSKLTRDAKLDYIYGL